MIRKQSLVTAIAALMISSRALATDADTKPETPKRLRTTEISIGYANLSGKVEKTVPAGSHLKLSSGHAFTSDLRTSLLTSWLEKGDRSRQPLLLNDVVIGGLIIGDGDDDIGVWGAVSLGLGAQVRYLLPSGIDIGAMALVTVEGDTSRTIWRTESNEAGWARRYALHPMARWELFELIGTVGLVNVTMDTADGSSVTGAVIGLRGNIDIGKDFGLSVGFEHERFAWRSEAGPDGYRDQGLQAGATMTWDNVAVASRFTVAISMGN